MYDMKEVIFIKSLKTQKLMEAVSTETKGTKENELIKVHRG